MTTPNNESAVDGVTTGYMPVGERGRRIRRTVEIGGGVLVDLDADSRIVGIETIGHGDFTSAAWRVLTDSRIRLIRND